jgi:hypothetical protein
MVEVPRLHVCHGDEGGPRAISHSRAILRWVKAHEDAPV